ncbi:MAG: mechanosensitive ion channel family protein [Bacillota bacterium]|nr:mechanosensitive ion channel family protein [Bacillota bacterium]
MVQDLVTIYERIQSYHLENDWLMSVIGAIVILGIFLLLRKLFTRYIFAFMLRFTQKSKTDLDDNIMTAFQIPVRVLFVVLGFYFALRYLPLNPGQDLLLSEVMRSAMVILIFWGLYELAGSHSFVSEELKSKMNVDAILVPFFSKVFRFIIIALAVVLVANEWDYDVNGFIAGLGLGGLAFALAAKDVLANIFGGIVIIMEKPFSIGDWVYTASVEGTVEDISFRSTKFRTFAHALVTVPNSTLANESIMNWTRMGKRRLTFTIGVTYSTSRLQMETCVRRIREMLIEHPDIHNELIMVNFEKFNDSSMDIFIYCFTNTTVWNEFLNVRQDVNLRIMDILDEEGVSMAFPSQSIYIENQKQEKTISDVIAKPQ